MNVSKAVGAIVVTVVLAAWAYIALTGEPRLPINIANGAYSNRCCGTVIFANGVMTVADQRVSYVVEEDKVGPYVLPKEYVGASNGRVIVRSGSFPSKLRLDDPAHPQQVELVDDAPGGKAYFFVRGDGLVGRGKSATLDAVEAFQRRNGLKPDRDLGGAHSLTRQRLALPVAKLVRAG
jgi:hypothetical protein